MKKHLLIYALISACIFAVGVQTGRTGESDYYNKFRYENRFAQKTEETRTQQKLLLDYDGRTDGQPVYRGYAARGVQTSADEWIIYKHAYDGNDQLTSVTTAFDAWDDRASATYE